MQHKRSKMTLLQRAKQFMPFAALKGFEALLEEEATYVERRKVLSEEQLEELDHQLQQLTTGDMISVEYYSGRSYVRIQGRLRKIDPLHKTMTVRETVIPMGSILQVNPLDEY